MGGEAKHAISCKATNSVFYVFIILAAIPKKRQQIRDIMERPKDGSNLKSLAAFP